MARYKCEMNFFLSSWWREIRGCCMYVYLSIIEKEEKAKGKVVEKQSRNNQKQKHDKM